MDVPSISSEGTICINKGELEKDSNLWIYDDIRLLNKDDAHVKIPVEYKTYCNKGNKWVYLGYLAADYDSQGEISVEDPIALINSTYIAFVPVNYKKENFDVGVYNFGYFTFSAASVSGYDYSTPVGVFSFKINDNDLIINFTGKDLDSI